MLLKYNIGGRYSGPAPGSPRCRWLEELWP